MRTMILAATASALVASALLAAPAVATRDKDYFDNLKVVGLATGGTQLVKFGSDSPKLWNIGTIHGLQTDVSLVGIDYRVQDGLLYGVGNAGGLYTLSTRDAKATKVGALAVPLSGTAFGVDFNPAANALRVVSNTGQNLRTPFTDAGVGVTVADAPLTVPATPTVPAATAVGITAAAYTNNDLSPATATTLFDIDTDTAPATATVPATDQVVIQSPANAGLVVVTGNLGVDATDAGFDIYSRIRNGRTVDQAGFATLTSATSSEFVRVNLLTGEATRIGTFKIPVTDLALPLSQR